MDTSETYIRMSDHPLIQKQHKPKEGDLYANTFMATVKSPRDADNDTGYYPSIELVIGCTPPRADGKDNRDLFKGPDWAWLPRQDKIQEMLGMINPDDWYSEMASDDGRVIWDCQMDGGKQDVGYMGFIDFASPAETGEQLWLALFMFIEHNLIWDGEKWKKK